MMYGRSSIRWPAVAAWAAGALLNFAMSPLSPIYVPQMPAVGANIPSLAAASAIYLVLIRVGRGQEEKPITG